MRREVELRDAFAFTCDDCGRDCYLEAITVSAEEVEEIVIDGETWTDEEQELAREVVREIVGGRGHARPVSEVQCKWCGSEFSVAGSPGDGIWDE